MSIRRLDHIGIVVNDLVAVKAFFVGLGLELMGEGNVQGEWVERIVGLDDMNVTAAMLKTPDGDANIELVKFHKPLAEQSVQSSAANLLGIRHLCFAVDNVEAIVAKLQEHGTELFGEIVNYRDTYKLCYVRGPEGIILELAEKLL